MTDYDLPSSGEEDENHFGDDELTDTKSSSERSSTDREEVPNILGPSVNSRKSSLSPPSDLGTLQSGPSQPKLKRYELKLQYVCIKCSSMYFEFDRYPQKECKRNFNSDWYHRRDWLEYSIERDAAFCFPCRMFGGRETSFTTIGFSSWNKATERFNSHVGTGSSIHQACTVSWKSYVVAQSKGSYMYEFVIQ